MDNASRHTAAPIINPSGYNLTGKKNMLRRSSNRDALRSVQYAQAEIRRVLHP